MHHIIVRGIERQWIFSDDQDRDNFVERLGDIVTDTETIFFAWALIPNHAHILLRTEKIPDYSQNAQFIVLLGSEKAGFQWHRAI